MRNLCWGVLLMLFVFSCAEGADVMRFHMGKLQVLDKLRGKSVFVQLALDANIGLPGREHLQLSLHSCDYDPEDGSYRAHLTIRSQGDGRVIFDDWLYSAFPTYRPIPHKVYDLRLISCYDPV